MQYWRFDPSSCGFPAPRVPVLPPPSLAALGKRQHPEFEPVGLGGEHRCFRFGRYALRQAYQLSGLGEGTALLAPSYHCRTMLDPAIRLGAAVHLYRLNADLTPDVDDISRWMGSRTHHIKALLLTHYFGMPQPAALVARLAELCRSQGVDLVEDCSHAMFSPKAATGTQGHKRVGQTGRFAVASPYKFFACSEGGLLWSNQGTRLADAGISAGWLPNARALKSFASAFGARPQQPAEVTAQDLELAGTDGQSAGTDGTIEDAGLSLYYDRREESKSCAIVARWSIRHSDQVHVVEHRRRHFKQWLDATRGLAHCQPLVEQLPADAVPYMFPLLVEDPSLHFHLLKHLGLPVWRWDDMAASTCTVATRYRLRLLHLPCHQALSPSQMQWMTQILRRVLSLPKAGPEP